MTNDQDSVSQRIAILRFLMIFGIVVLHAPPYVPIWDVPNNPFDLFKAFFQHAVFRTTVPMLTFISAYLLFRSGLDLTPVKLARKKFRSIIVPFLVFNLGLLGAMIALHHGLHITLPNNIIPQGAKAWLDAAFGLTGSPINYPLNFLRDLTALMIVAPLIGCLLRYTPWLGLVLVSLVYQFNLDGPFVLRDVMWPVFYCGGLAAVHKWNMRALDRYAALCLAMFLALCAYVIWFRVANTSTLRLVAPVLIWPAASLLVPTAFGRWLAYMSKYSFFVFVAHAPVLLVTMFGYKLFEAYIPYPVYWVAAPVITTALLVGVYSAGVRAVPNLFNLVFGTRLTPLPSSQKPKTAAPSNAGNVDMEEAYPSMGT